jgi:hypothetical protein
MGTGGDAVLVRQGRGDPLGIGNPVTCLASEASGPL